MRSLSDHALRRWAWSVWWSMLAVFACAVVVAFADSSSSRSDDGNGGDVGELLFGLIILTFSLVGLVILIRQPRNRVGWLLAGVGVVANLGGLLDAYATYGLVINPGSVPRPDVAAALGAGAWAPTIGLMGTFVILLFPDGRLPSSRWRPLAWLSAATIVAVTVTIAVSPGSLDAGPVPTMLNPLGIESAKVALIVLLGIFLPLLPLCIVASAAALVWRFRRSHGVEREQMKWLAAAGAAVAVSYLATMASTLAASFLDDTPEWVSALQRITILGFVLLPLAIGVAVLRYRLYDIDVVINRALVYGGLTITLLSTYLVMVLVMQALLRPLTEQSDLGVAASTLAVAALFGPARRRIQAVVDRRFYRRRYDAARILSAFAGRLRQELDLEAVGADLSAAVRETVQPAHVSLWLRNSS